MKIGKKSLLAFSIIAILVAAISAWTTTSPPMMEVLSEAQISNSIFSSSRSTATYNFIDKSAHYTFKFGFDYPDVNLSRGTKTEFKVYVVLTGEYLSSPFARGVSIQVQSASLLVDGSVDSGISIVNRFTPSVLTLSLQFPNTNISSGTHLIAVRLLVVTIDLYYIGYSQGTERLVLLNGTMSIG